MHKKDTSCFLPDWPYNLHFWGKGRRQGRGLACGLDMSSEGPQRSVLPDAQGHVPEAEEMDTYVLPARAHAGLLGPHREPSTCT